MSTVKKTEADGPEADGSEADGPETVGLPPRRESEARLSSRLSLILEATADLNTMLTDTDALYASLLERLSRAVPFSSGSIQVLEGGSARIVAFRGDLDPEVVMGLVFPMDPLYPNYRVVSERRPIAFADIQLAYPHFLSESEKYASGHIRSWLGVPMIGSGEVIGMIALDRDVVDPFFPDDIRIVQGFSDHAAVAIRNSITYRRLQEALRAKDRLMLELRHRVKNNLQMIMSFVSIHSSLATSEEDKTTLEELNGRIGSIATAYEHLTRDVEAGADVDLSVYLREVCEDFATSFLGRGGRMRLSLELEPLHTDVSLAMPLGLILNELLTNALKYAFPGSTAGTVSVELGRSGEGALLRVEDDGVGFAARQAPSRPDGGIGTQLVRGLVEQLGGRAELDSRPGKTTWTLRFGLSSRS